MINLLTRNALAVITIIALGITNGYSQADTTSLSAYEDLSLKDLLKVKIVSVSKNAEFLFDAPLSASVLSREEIHRAGCTSIMDALRLVPGIIVKEQSNGNFDIHLRGINVPPNPSFEGNSATTLVMIDSRPIYSYLKGGTLWETLPVDLNDVERIEVIRGPAAALYGPNAVNGVINIITRQTKKEGLYLVANARQGSLNTSIHNASIGFQSQKWSTIVSGNYQHRDRSQTSYFEFSRDSLLNLPEYFITFLGDTNTFSPLYPRPKLAMEKYAGNVFFNYNPLEKVTFNLAAGIQHAIVQKVSTENTGTPLSTSSSNSQYVDLRANLNGFSAQLSYNEGTQAVEYYPGNKYDFNTLEASIEYNYTKDKFSLKPGLSYRSAIYDDTKYADGRTGMFNARVQITTYLASLRAEYKFLSDKLRLVAGIVANKFNYPDTVYLSYQLAATYRLNKKNFFRAVHSRAIRSATVYDPYVDQLLYSYPTGPNNLTEILIQGNKNIKLLIADMIEIGYRGSIGSGMSIDIELFNTNSKNYNSFITNRAYTKIVGVDTVEVNPIMSTNLPLTMLQKGITVSFTYSSKKFQMKPFVTFQQSKAKNYAPFPNTPDAGLGMLQNDNPQQNNIYSAMGTETVLKSMPSVFGGASVNYMPNKKLNLNLNAYYYSSQTSDHMSNLIYNDGIRGIDHLHAKLILNMNVSYQLTNGWRIFCTGKNILNDRYREYFRTDAIPFMLLGGINYQF